MANYKIKISSSAEKFLKKVGKKDLSSLVELIQTLAIQPRPSGCRKLSGEKNAYRVRHGQYRVIYEIQDKELIIWVLKIGNRKDIYQKR